MSRANLETLRLEGGHVADRFLGLLKARGYEERYGAGELGRGQYRAGVEVNGWREVSWLELTDGDNRAMKIGLGQIRRRAEERGMKIVKPEPAAESARSSTSNDVEKQAEPPRQKRKYTRRAPKAATGETKSTRRETKKGRRATKSVSRATKAPRTSKTIAEYREAIREQIRQLEAKLGMLDEIEALL